MNLLSPSLLGILVATLGGAAVGVERQRSGHASGPNARFGGVRTFTLLGGVAGTAGWLTSLHYTGLGTALAAGAVALIIVGYLAASRHDIDGTTETAALVVVGAGLTAGLGWLALASATVAVTTLLLAEKSQLHALVSRIDDEELRSAARFGVMAIVILPLLPEGPYGPLGGVRPRELWLLVLFFTGLSFVGYLARRLFGANRGYPFAGLLAGIVSSTNLTFTFARLSRREPDLSQPLAIGTIGACTVLFPRVLVATVVLNPLVAAELWLYLATPMAFGLLGMIWWWRGNPAETPKMDAPSNPLQFWPAVQMAVVFQVVLFIVEVVRRFGERSLLLSASVVGLTDVDALTISMSKVQGVSPLVAARAIAIGVATNCALKTALAAGLGTPRFRRVAMPAVAAMTIALGVSLALW